MLQVCHNRNNGNTNSNVHLMREGISVLHDCCNSRAANSIVIAGWNSSNVSVKALGIRTNKQLAASCNVTSGNKVHLYIYIWMQQSSHKVNSNLKRTVWQNYFWRDLLLAKSDFQITCRLTLWLYSLRNLYT